MHELSLVQSVVGAVAERTAPTRVTVVRLEIGRLSGVVVDSVRFCFEWVAEGTTLAGARLEVTGPAGHARCRDCAREFDADDPIVLCPGCGGADVSVLAGRDLRITSVEVIDECAAPAAARTAPECG